MIANDLGASVIWAPLIDEGAGEASGPLVILAVPHTDTIPASAARTH
ncbi:hypothetical protein ACWFRJ_34085 [Streptomyces sp. NPDC055239]